MVGSLGLAQRHNSNLAVSAFVGYQLLKAPAGGGEGGAPGGETGTK